MLHPSIGWGCRIWTALRPGRRHRRVMPLPNLFMDRTEELMFGNAWRSRTITLHPAYRHRGIMPLPNLSMDRAKELTFGDVWRSRTITFLLPLVCLLHQSRSQRG